MSPFLRRIAKRHSDPAILTWLLVVVAKFTLTRQGVSVCVEIQRLVEGRPQPFDETIEELHGLQYRHVLYRAEPSWHKGCIHFLSFCYWDEDKLRANLSSRMYDTQQLFRRRYWDYIRQHGKPTYLGWSVVALANIMGAQHVHLHDEDQGWLSCHSLMTASCQLEEMVCQLQKRHQAMLAGGK